MSGGLAGKRVVVTQAAHQAPELGALLAERAAQPEGERDGGHGEADNKPRPNPARAQAEGKGGRPRYRKRHDPVGHHPDPHRRPRVFKSPQRPRADDLDPVHDLKDSADNEELRCQEKDGGVGDKPAGDGLAASHAQDHRVAGANGDAVDAERA